MPALRIGIAGLGTVGAGGFEADIDNSLSDSIDLFYPIGMSGKIARVRSVDYL